MKTKLILGSFLALTSIANAQWGGTNPLTTSSNVGIKTASPTDNLEVVCGSPDGGITITQPSTGSYGSRLVLKNKTVNGKDWALISCGNGNSQGAGNLLVYDYSSGTDRMLIQGSNGYVGIGTLAPSAKLEVNNHITGSGGYYGFKSIIDYVGSSNDVLVGVRGEASSVVNAYASCIGVSALGTGGQRNYGGIFSATGDTTVFGHSMYGVYSSVNGATSTDWAGYFVGRVYTSSNTYFTASDQRLKKNIQPITNGLEKLRLLKPSTYEYRTSEFKNLVLSEGQQMGLIAQDLEKIFPELVTNIAANDKYNDKGEVIETLPEHKAVNYMGLIPVLISAVQDQDKLVSVLQKQIEEQKQVIDALTQKVSGTTGIGTLNSVETGFQMSQNEPNPFTHETVVKYALPQTISNAFMAVYDLTGKQITTFPINQKGSSSITITSEKLSAGIYIYSIVADGKVVDSKRMIVAEK